jgi:large subunit ribosomal protein L6
MPVDAALLPLSGTLRAYLPHLVKGVSVGVVRKLELVGVGYRAAMQGKDLNLSLGFSHPVLFQTPEGITIATPTQTEIMVSGADKQRVGEVAAKIRGFRPPEPYKGKGVKYAGEVIIRKEAKKA